MTRMTFDFSLGRGRAIHQAAEEAAYERAAEDDVTAFGSLTEAEQSALLKEAEDAYDDAAEAAYERQQERNFTNYWEG